MSTLNTLRQVKPHQLKHEWIFERVVSLFGKERLEKWKDRVAEYWEMAIDGIDQDQLLRALVRLYGKKEGKKLLRISRSDRVKILVDGEAMSLINDLVVKVDKIVKATDDRLEATNLSFEEHPYSEATVIHEGRTTFCKVDGLICITGVISAHHSDGTTSRVTVFARWISHPFWQYSYRTKETQL